MPADTKIALITGGSRGLGRSTALALAARGVDVILTYNANRAEADKTVGAIAALGRKAVALQLDAGNVASFGAFRELVWGTLSNLWDRETFDFLVNNAGMGAGGMFAETTEAEFDLLMNVHFKGVYFLTQTLLPVIADGGRVINLSTGLTRFTLPGLSAYAAMKGAVEVLTHYLAKELGPRGITCNTVAPGAIETDFGGGFIRDNPEARQHVAAITALGRTGLPDDIGPMIAAMLSEDNRWVNGQRIEVSGGAYL